MAATSTKAAAERMKAVNVLSLPYCKTSGTPPAQKSALVASYPTTYLSDRIQKNQGTFYPSMGLKHFATFANIPTCAPPERRGVGL